MGHPHQNDTESLDLIDKSIVDWEKLYDKAIRDTRLHSTYSG
jgi:hypothetical protein